MLKGTRNCMACISVQGIVHPSLNVAAATSLGGGGAVAHIPNTALPVLLC